MKLKAVIINIAAVALAVISFTPLVIPYYEFEPKLMGWPYTMWVGTLVSLLFIFLTYLASLEDPDTGDDSN